MRDLTLRDKTQVHIIKHLEVTESMLAQAATEASGSEKNAEIWAMPDLGLPLNVARIHGGFFTGALYTWDSSVPFVPIDATVNCCGVSVFKIRNHIPSTDIFLEMMNQAILKTQESSYIWNFDMGNHFIIYGEIKNSTSLQDGYYVILHSSASEFKNQYNGLYPTKGNWYSDKIKITWGNKNNRYLRYIVGKNAEHFVQLAQMLIKYNEIRHRFFASLLFGENNIEEEVQNIQHYGMPTANSIAIGCQWFQKKSLYFLLTAPDIPIYIVESFPGEYNYLSLNGKNFHLSSHGLGLKSTKSLEISYEPEKLKVNGKEFNLNERLSFDKDVQVRSFQISTSVPAIVNETLSRCPGNIVGQFNPIYSYDRRNSK